jgi:hypothetical protein
VYLTGLHLSRPMVRIKALAVPIHATWYLLDNGVFAWYVGAWVYGVHARATPTYIYWHGRITCVPRCNRGKRRSELQNVAQRGEHRCMRKKS